MEIVALKNCAHFLSGGTPSKSMEDYWGGELPWLSAKDMKSFYVADTEDHITELGARNGTRTIEEGGILVLTRGMTLLHDVPICLAHRRMAFNQDVKGIVARDGVDARYLAYALLAAKRDLLSFVELAGHGTGRLPTDRLESLPIRVPKLSEQQAIAGILGALDDKIELNRRTNKTLEAMARALFKSWFVDFDPVRAKAEGRKPSGISVELTKVFPREFSESQVGPIPKGWRVMQLGDWVSLVRGTTYKSSLLGSPGPYLLGLASIRRDGGFRADALRTYGGESPSKLLVKLGELYVSLKDVTQSADLLGAAARVPRWLQAGGRLTQDTVRLDLENGTNAMKVFTYWLLLTPQYRAYCRSRAIGTTNLSLSRDDFLAFHAVVPSEEALEALMPHLQSLTDRLENAGENQSLVKIRDALLPKLLSGELRIKDAERFVEAAA
jgi:type I restriction enzyme S subunit